MWKKFSRILPPASGRKQPIRPRFQPRIEGLEERSLPSVTPAFHVNTRTVLDQAHPAVASQPVPGGRSVVVWEDTFNQEGTDIDIKAQLYDGAGNRVGGEISVATSIFRETQPAVAMD